MFSGTDHFLSAEVPRFSINPMDEVEKLTDKVTI